jgi:Uma2 family endonuclease
MSAETTLLFEDLVGRPEFQGLPYKVETTAGGQIIMSPHLNSHSAFQRAIERHLETLMRSPGVALQEFAIQTEDGVKVPDVVWLTPEELATARDVSITDKAPRICVGVNSKGNTAKEIGEKARLYFAQGAKEVWVCDLKGNVSFLTEKDGPVSHSCLCPTFPTLIDPFTI